MSKYLIEILKKMCEMVGTDYESIDFKKEDWFTTEEWSQEDQNEFRDWLIDHMKKNAKARRELMAIPSTRVKFLRDFSNMFVFNYGWKFKS